MSTDDTTRYDSCDAWLRKQAPGFVPAESLIWALCNFVQGHTPEPTNAEELEQEIKDLRKINTAHVSRARRLGQRAKEALGVGKADRAKDRDDAGLGAGFEGAFDLLIARLCGMQHIIAMVLKNTLRAYELQSRA